MKNFTIVLLTLITTITGCASGTTTSFTEEKIDQPKLIALDAPRAPWVVEIEARLRKEGFKVLRRASTKRVTEKASDTRTEEYLESSARYILVIEGFAPLDPMNKCIGGGYKFSNITAELVDTKNNETIISTSGSGYSENCPPLSGTIFGDITKSVVNAWK